jgi:hypothetical protein
MHINVHTLSISISISITLIFFSIYKAYYISNQNQNKVDIFKIFKDEVNNVFVTNIFRQVKTGKQSTCIPKQLIYHMTSEFL